MNTPNNNDQRQKQSEDAANQDKTQPRPQQDQKVPDQHKNDDQQRQQK